MTDADERLAAYETALMTIAAATVAVRRQTSGFTIPTQAAQELLVQCEHALSSLIALGLVPGQRPALPSPPYTAGYIEGRAER